MSVSVKTLVRVQCELKGAHVDSTSLFVFFFVHSCLSACVSVFSWSSLPPCGAPSPRFKLPISRVCRFHPPRLPARSSSGSASRVRRHRAGPERGAHQGLRRPVLQAKEGRRRDAAASGGAGVFTLRLYLSLPPSLFRLSPAI